MSENEQDTEQLERLRQAVDRKSEEARAASESGPPGTGPDEGAEIEGDQRSLTEKGRPQDARSVREKSSGHGKKTADKWNQ